MQTKSEINMKPGMAVETAVKGGTYVGSDAWVRRQQEIMAAQKRGK